MIEAFDSVVKQYEDEIEELWKEINYLRQELRKAKSHKIEEK